MSDAPTMTRIHQELEAEIRRLNDELVRLEREEPENTTRRAAIVIAMRVSEQAVGFVEPLVHVADDDLADHPKAASAQVNLGRIIAIDDPADGFVRTGALYDTSVDPPEDVLARTRAICAEACDALAVESPSIDGF